MIYGIHDNPHLPEETRRELAQLRAAQGSPGPGLGDLVAAATKALGIEQRPDCGCHKKQATLNRLTPRWVRSALAAVGLHSSHGSGAEVGRRSPQGRA
jgi:hypothetical protein